MKFSTEMLQRLTQLFVAELKVHFADQPEIGIAQVESETREMLRELGASSLSTFLQEQDDAYPQAEIRCSCGEPANYQYRRSAQTLSVFGWVSYRRAYYLCPSCHQGTMPLDRRMGLEPGKVSAGLAPLLAMGGTRDSFGEAAQEVKRYLLLDVSENTVRKETQTFGQLQMAREEAWIAESQDAEVYRERHRTASERPTRLYGTLDGAHAPMQTEWREMKVGVWFDVETIPREQVAAYRRARVGEMGALRAKNITYYCDIQEAKEFGSLVWATGCQRNADLAQELVFIADGAAWIWNLVGLYYPQAVQIVDWYHAEEYLEAVSRAAFAGNPEGGSAWLEPTRTALWEGQVEEVIAACRQFEDHSQAQLEAHKAINYFAHNRERMDYARFRAAGYMIGSGTVESGCKQIVSQRLKLPGARWLVEGARATAKARAVYLSGQWDELSTLRSNLPLAV